MRKVTKPRLSDNPLAAALAQRDSGVLDMVREAVRHRQMLLAFQPVVQARHPARVAFHEGLIRVLDETGRIIPAREFMAAVEETETGRTLDCISLEKGLRALATTPRLRLSVNMSARSIGYRRWIRTLEQGLARNPTVGERLVLEINETSAMTMPELVVDFMTDLQRRGIAFALDDFGAGLTALRHFRDFQFDIVKIDGQFARGIARDPDNQVLTQSMVQMARNLDMFTVACRVERADDAAHLAGLGVDCLQGYYYGAPTIHPPWAEEKAEPLRA